MFRFLKYIAILFILSPILKANNFDFAETELNKLTPDSSYSEILEVRSLFEELISVDKVKAVNLLSHLSYFEGFLYQGNAVRTPKEVFNECRENLNAIKNDAPVVYKSWDTICMALWFNDLGVGAIFHVNKVQDRLYEILDENLNVKQSFLSSSDVNFIGGGIYRVLARIFIDKKSLTILRGINRELTGQTLSESNLKAKIYSKASEFSQKALDTSSHSLSKRNGFEYGSNYRVYAQSLWLLSENELAIEQINLGLEMIQELIDDGLATYLDKSEKLVLEKTLQELNQ